MGISESWTFYPETGNSNLMASILKLTFASWLNEILTDAISNVLEMLSVTIFLTSLIVFGCLILLIPLDRPQVEEIIEHRPKQIPKKRKHHIVKRDMYECEAASYLIRRTRSGCIYGLYLFPGEPGPCCSECNPLCKKTYHSEACKKTYQSESEPCIVHRTSIGRIFNASWPDFKEKQ